MREYLLERDPGVLLVRCGGRLTIEVAGRLKGELDEAFREGGFSVGRKTLFEILVRII